MAGHLQGTFRIKLTTAQERMVRQLVKDAAALGDVISRRVWTLEFPDYEGLQSFLGKVYSIPAPTTRLYRTKDALLNKLCAAKAGA